MNTYLSTPLEILPYVIAKRCEFDLLKIKPLSFLQCLETSSVQNFLCTYVECKGFLTSLHRTLRNERKESIDWEQRFDDISNSEDRMLNMCPFILSIANMGPESIAGHYFDAIQTVKSLAIDVYEVAGHISPQLSESLIRTFIIVATAWIQVWTITAFESIEYHAQLNPHAEKTQSLDLFIDTYLAVESNYYEST